MSEVVSFIVGGSLLFEADTNSGTFTTIVDYKKIPLIDWLAFRDLDDEAELSDGDTSIMYSGGLLVVETAHTMWRIYLDPEIRTDFISAVDEIIQKLQ